MPGRSAAKDNGSSEERVSGEEAEKLQVAETNNGVGADEDDSDEDKPKKGGGNQGRRKIDIEFIEDKNKRHITFSKRKAGIMKKAYELSTLTGTQVLLLVVSETGLVYTYTTPKLSNLVMAREGKNLIQKCLTISEDGATPPKDYPDPKLRHYAPRGQKHATPPISHPPSPVRASAAAPSTLSNESIPYTASTPSASIASTSTSYSAPIPAGPYHPQQIGMTTGSHHQAMTSQAQMPPTSSYDYPASYLQTAGMPSYSMQQAAPGHQQQDYGYVSLPPMPAPAAAPSSPAQKPSLKKRKTVENIKKASQKDLASAKSIEATEGANRTLEVARQTPNIENLLRAFTMQDEATKNINDKTFERGVSATMTELHMAINHNLLLSSGSIPDLAMSSSAERIDALFLYFFKFYVATKPDLDRKDLQNYATDLIALAVWLLAQGFINHSTHMSLVRHCATAKLGSPQKGNASPTSPRKNEQTRKQGAIQMLADYSVFAADRYKNHWEQSVSPITGHFNLLSVSETFLILDEPMMDASQEYISTLAPFKLRMPRCLNRLLKKRDALHLTIRKAQGSSFWLPTASGDITLAHAEANLPEYDPQPEIHRYEMEQCQQNEDQVGFAVAFAAYQKATRGDSLLSMGEFDDEGFRPRDLDL